MKKLHELRVIPVFRSVPGQDESSVTYLVTVSIEESTMAAAMVTASRMTEEPKPDHRLTLQDLSMVFASFAGGTNKIEAIKRVREFASCDLRTAKDVVEGNFGR